MEEIDFTFLISQMEKIAVNCKTQQEEYELMRLYTKKDWVWSDGDRPKIHSYRDTYGEKSCYDFNDRFYVSDTDWCESHGYKVISFQEAKAILEGKTKKPTYEKVYRRSDGVIFEKDKIDGKTIKELEKNIEKNNEENKRIESLLRAYRELKF